MIALRLAARLCGPPPPTAGRSYRYRSPMCLRRWGFQRKASVAPLRDSIGHLLVERDEPRDVGGDQPGRYEFNGRDARQHLRHVVCSDRGPDVVVPESPGTRGHIPHHAARPGPRAVGAAAAAPRTAGVPRVRCPSDRLGLLRVPSRGSGSSPSRRCCPSPGPTAGPDTSERSAPGCLRAGRTCYGAGQPRAHSASAAHMYTEAACFVVAIFQSVP